MSRRLGTAVIAAGVAAAGVACGSGGPTPATGSATYAPSIDSTAFTSVIDNPYLPLIPGSRWVYEGESEGRQERIEVTVTDRTREVMGVTCVVVRDEVRVDGELAELTFDWYAQDSDGNVWYFGEATAEYENGKVKTTEGSWEAGIDGAQPGILMPASPDIGKTYRQEYYAGHAEDMGKVVQLGESVTVPFGSFQDVLVTEDWTPLDPKLLEHKYYAEGVGVVLERSLRGPTELVELVDFRAPGS